MASAEVKKQEEDKERGGIAPHAVL